MLAFAKVWTLNHGKTYIAPRCASADVNKLPERIADAEAVLVMRARELFYRSGDRFEEEESLDDAMCVLNALRSSLKRRPSAIQSNQWLGLFKNCVTDCAGYWGVAFSAAAVAGSLRQPFLDGRLSGNLAYQSQLLGFEHKVNF